MPENIFYERVVIKKYVYTHNPIFQKFISQKLLKNRNDNTGSIFCVFCFFTFFYVLCNKI